MTGFDCVLEALDIFECSLEAAEGVLPIRTSGELARRAGYSSWHFARLFAAAVGMPPKEYISGRILSEAAKLVVTSAIPLALVAETFAFPDYESFSRSFKSRFGVTPRNAREGRMLPRAVLARAYPRRVSRPGNLSSADGEPVDLGSFSMAGLQFFIDDGIGSFHRQWAAFMAIASRVAGKTDNGTYYQFSSWTDDDALGGLSVLCAAETISGAVQEPVFTARTVPPASYFRFVHSGDPSTLGETYEYIYRDWFASREARPADFWEFQRYSGGGKTTEIFIPVAIR